MWQSETLCGLTIQIEPLWLNFHKALLGLQQKKLELHFDYGHFWKWKG